MNDETRSKLHKLYDLVPKVNCKGLCTDECTTLGMFRGEFVQLTRATGKEPKFDLKTERCNYLENGRCSAYDDRPYVCRAWGASEEMVCPHGCVPDKGYLPHVLETLLLNEIGSVLGSHEMIWTARPEDLIPILLREGFSKEEADVVAQIMTKKRFQVEIIHR